MISQQEQLHWSRKGWVAFPRRLGSETANLLPQWVEAMAATPSEKEDRLQYFEATRLGPRLCRTERFLADSDKLCKLITGDEVLALASELIGGQAVLYKEKINYKLPGGAGFSAHQDATAYAFASRIITCLVAVDPMTPDNGGIEFASGFYDDLLVRDDQGCIPENIANRFEWESVNLPAGGLVFFTSLVPHRSGPNLSDRPRRALYLTYNLLSEGDFRETYYRERARQMKRRPADGESAMRISNIGHFQGMPLDKPVTEPAQIFPDLSNPDPTIEKQTAFKRRANS